MLGLRAFVCVAAAALIPAAATAQSAEVTETRILKFGPANRACIAADRGQGSPPCIGYRTDQIAAITGTDFYVEYVLEGTPTGAPVPVEHTVLHFPVGVYNPADPDAFLRLREPATARIGTPRHAGWGFGPEQYVAPGNWVVQVRIDGRVVAEKMFEIVLP